MNLKLPVSHIMTRKIISLSPNDNLQKVKDIFDTTKIHHIPILLSGQLIGMISKTDLLHFLKGYSGSAYDKLMDEIRLDSFLVKEVMTKGLAKLEPTDRIEVAIEVFKENLFRALPVVEGDFLVGIVSVVDILRYISE